MRIILASTSPRRIALVGMLAEKLGMEYECVNPRYEEFHSSYDKPEEIVKTHAMGKALSVSLDHKGLIIGGDLLVVFEGTVIGKPKGKNDAKRILRMLSGKWHEVITGIAVINTENEKKIVDAVVSRIKLKNLKDGQIDEYVNTGEPLDKAGAYDVGGTFGRFIVEKVEGDVDAIRGLPFKKLKEMINSVTK
jgi:septum formation protein